MPEDLTTLEICVVALATLLVMAIALVVWGVSVLLRAIAADERERRRAESDACRDEWYATLHQINTNAAVQQEAEAQRIEQSEHVTYCDFYRWRRRSPDGRAQGRNPALGADTVTFDDFGLGDEVVLALPYSRN